MKNNRFQNYFSKLPLTSFSFIKLRLLVTLFIIIVSSTLGITAWHLKEQRDAQFQMIEFGETMASQISELAVEPLISEDRIRLHFLTNKMADFKQVVGVSISSVDNQLISVAGRSTNNPQLPIFTNQITVQQTIAGVVRVAVEPNAFRTTLSEKFQASIVWVLAALLVAGLFEVFFEMTVTRNSKNPKIEDRLLDAPRNDFCNALVVNLFDQISLTQDNRKNLVEQVTHLSLKVANLYAASVFKLSGTGVLLAFDKSQAKDRVFEIVCAALLLRTILKKMTDYPLMSYRFGLHQVPRNEISNTSKSEYISDAILLSALAQEGQISVSSEVNQELEDIDSVEKSEQSSTAVTALSTTGPNFYIVYGVTESYRNLIEQQAALIFSNR